MPDQAKAPSVVDLDGGGGFGRDVVTLLRPFKFKGVTYTEVKFRVPTGFDLQKNGRANGIDATALMCDLAELSQDVFDAMYAGDRNRVDLAVGKHLAGLPATSTSSSPTSGSATPSPTAS